MVNDIFNIVARWGDQSLYFELAREMARQMPFSSLLLNLRWGNDIDLVGIFILCGVDFDFLELLTLEYHQYFVSTDANLLLNFATERNLPGLTRALIRAGADPSVKNRRNETALEFAQDLLKYAPVNGEILKLLGGK